MRVCLKTENNVHFLNVNCTWFQSFIQPSDRINNLSWMWGFLLFGFDQEDTYLSLFYVNKNGGYLLIIWNIHNSLSQLFNLFRFLIYSFTGFLTVGQCGCSKGSCFGWNLLDDQNTTKVVPSLQKQNCFFWIFLSTDLFLDTYIRCV